MSFNLPSGAGLRHADARQEAVCYAKMDGITASLPNLVAIGFAD
jgi:hypothetical protein